MIVWKKGPKLMHESYQMSSLIDGETDWTLVDENNDEIIATITISLNSDNTCNVDAICKKIGFASRFEHLARYKLKTIMSDLKRSVKYEINHVREENQKPAERKIYSPIDGIPVWQHLKNGVEETEIHLKASDFGKLTEAIGKRILGDILLSREILNNIFPGIDILRVRFIKNFKVLERAKIGLGDIVLEIDHKKDGKFGKKIAVFEIKHGKVIIDQNQFRRYCSMVLNPGEYFKKADELKLIYMMFDHIDTMNGMASYSISEIDKDFARIVLERTPLEGQDGINYYGIANSSTIDHNICDGLKMVM